MKAACGRERPARARPPSRVAAARARTLAPTSHTWLLSLNFSETEFVETTATQSDQLKVEPLLLEVADVVNTTLDLDTTLAPRGGTGAPGH